jgi:putative endopeptidase
MLSSRRWHRFVQISAALAIAGTPTTQSVLAQQRPAASIPTTRIERLDLDTTCAACSDFYTFSNGGWAAHTAIPSSDAEVSTLSTMEDGNQRVLRALIEGAEKAARRGKLDPASDQFKIGFYYDACMDTLGIERRGGQPLSVSLKRITDIRTSADLPAAFAALERSDGIAPFTAFLQPDIRNSTRIIPVVVERGMSLPGKAYYLSPDTSMMRIRTAFLAHVARTLELSGDTPASAKSNAQTIMRLETTLARATMDAATFRNPDSVYHLVTIAQLDSMAPHVGWARYFRQQGARGRSSDIDVTQPRYIATVDSLMESVPANEWRLYLRWRLVHTSASLLAHRFADERFAYDQLFSGQQKPSPRWETCTAALTRDLGYAISREYVRQHFDDAAKARADELVASLTAVLHDRIAQLDWMSDSTRRNSLAKLEMLRRKIGYPDRWIDYSKVTFRPGRYYENFKTVRIWYIARNWAKVGKPIDKSEWTMQPSAVNAYYRAVANELVFPAGILQPPLFDPDGDPALNFGAIGAIIGHELSHGFDDQGRRYDASGNLRDWWTRDDVARFTAQAKRVEKQFDAYTIVDSTTHLNGERTLGENIADLGGLKIAFLAMERTFEKNGRPGLVDGFTPEQRFFLAWARTWRAVSRPEALKTQVATDSHSPAKWRVNGPLSNMPEFARAWGCKPEDAMVRPDSVRARLW